MLRPKVTRVSVDRILRAVIISDIDDQSLCDLSDNINYTARVDDDNVGDDSGDAGGGGVPRKGDKTDELSRVNNQHDSS